MNELALFMEAFHLIRPWWLLAWLPLAALWLLWRKKRGPAESAGEALAPHLRAALTIGKNESRRFQPIDAVVLCLALLVLAAAGPSWTRMPNPFVAQTSPLVIVLKVTPSMLSTDVAPTRLDRARQKIRDLLDLRVGARTALVAYAGTAHRVVPLTEDPRLIEPYLAGLSPEVMPRGGADIAAAKLLATQILSGESVAGSILYVTDDNNAESLNVMAESDEYSAVVLSMLPAGQSGGAAGSSHLAVVEVTPDDGDVQALERNIRAAYRQALSRDSNQPWDDRGWWIAWPAALILLWGFRKGFTLGRPPGAIASVALIGLGVFLAAPQAARADGVADWFFTPDQQGHRAMERRDFATAEDRFTDPMWKNYAMYRQGKYEEAAEAYSQLPTAAAAFGQAMSLIKSRKYRDAVRAFELTLDRDPDFPGAAANLETAKEIVEYIEATREASDTGEEAGIGADDVVFDNESGRGADTLIEGPKEGSGLLSADQWMNTVDTRTDDFLRQRFAIEASRDE